MKNALKSLALGLGLLTAMACSSAAQAHEWNERDAWRGEAPRPGYVQREREFHRDGFEMRREARRDFYWHMRREAAWRHHEWREHHAAWAHGPAYGYRD